MVNRKTLVLLLGPTGVGKTELSLRVAEHYGCPIFNVFQHIVELTPTADDALVLTSTDYNNTYDLEQRLGETMDVVIKRPIKAEEWDALSLPFSLSAEEVIRSSILMPLCTSSKRSKWAQKSS